MVNIIVKKAATAPAEIRKQTTAEIKILRKFEGRRLIDERIDAQMTKLHRLWFKTKLL